MLTDEADRTTATGQSNRLSGRYDGNCGEINQSTAQATKRAGVAHKNLKQLKKTQLINTHDEQRKQLMPANKHTFDTTGVTNSAKKKNQAEGLGRKRLFVVVGRKEDVNVGTRRR